MITARIDGIPYQGFLSVMVSRALDNLSGQFSIKVAPTDPERIPLKVGGLCEIWVEDEPFLRGYVDRLEGFATVDNDSLTYTGRDQTSDLIDSYFLDKKDFTSNTTFEGVINQVLDLQGLRQAIGVSKSSDSINTKFNDGEVLSAEQGDNIYEFLHKYAIKKNVLLTTDGSGNILLTRASEIPTDIKLLKLSTPTLNNNNIIESAVYIDQSQRFGVYQRHSQLSFNQFTENSNNVNVQQKTTDPEIRSSRTFSVNANTSSNEADLKNASLWERNYRRATGFQYDVSVQGHSVFETGEIWKPNILVQVIDEKFDINTVLLIKYVEFEFSVEQGSTTRITMVPPDAYTLQFQKAKLSQKDQTTNFIQFTPN